MVAVNTQPMYRNNRVFPASTHLPGIRLPLGKTREKKKKARVLPITQEIINTALGSSNGKEDMLALVRPNDIVREKPMKTIGMKDRTAFERLLDKSETWLHSYRYTQSETETYMMVPILETEEKLGAARCTRTISINNGELEYSLIITNMRAAMTEQRQNVIKLMSAGIVYYFLQEAGTLSGLKGAQTLTVNTRIVLIESDDMPEIARKAGEQMFWGSFTNRHNESIH